MTGASSTKYKYTYTGAYDQMAYTGFELECRDVNDYSVSNTQTLEVTGVGTWEASFTYGDLTNKEFISGM